MRLNSITDIGIKRKENQDNYWSAVYLQDGIETGIICLCDGMGGLNNGGLASSIVVKAVRDSIKEGIVFDGLEDVIIQANKTVYELSKDENSPMGTTCTIVQCQNKRYKILHVGDSRCYLLRGNSFNPLTTDHSALKKYNITKEKDERLWRRYKNSLTKCIGVKPTVQVDKLEGTLEDDDVLLVCSDGMWHYFEENSFSRSDLCNLKNLVEKCIENGETDNITGGVLWV